MCGGSCPVIECISCNKVQDSAHFARSRRAYGRSQRFGSRQCTAVCLYQNGGQVPHAALRIRPLAPWSPRPASVPDLLVELGLVVVGHPLALPLGLDPVGRHHLLQVAKLGHALLLLLRGCAGWKRQCKGSGLIART